MSDPSEPPAGVPIPQPRRPTTRVGAWLDRVPSPVFVSYAVVAAFGTYFCMYAFRKPFAAAKFEGELFFDSFLELKSAIIISQVIGYALSKYLGIKVCSELSPKRHAIVLVGLIVGAGLALLVYAWLPGSWKVVAIFWNGLALGMVWGLVVRYLEGRRSSEILLAGLSCSFIVSSGIVKDVGRAFMSGGAADWWATVPVFGAGIAASLGEVSESWMPFWTGVHFLPLFLLFVWMLNQIPPPSAADVAARTRRESMDGRRRVAFMSDYLVGIVMLAIAYFFLTAFRDFRDNYAVEILEGLGYPYAGNETIITRAETLVAVGVMVMLALLNTVRNNRLGLVATYALMASGTLLMAVSTLMLDAGMIDGFWWMTLVGLGSYLAYVPYGSVLFDRLMASTGAIGTAVFAIYLADAIGYTGSVGLLIYKDFAVGEVSRLAFFKSFTWGMAGLGTLCLITSCAYFVRRSKAEG
jgi:hypothetical protein